MKTKRKVGILDGQNVYYSESNGWLIRNEHGSALRDMDQEEIERFMSEPLEILGEYDYSLSKFRREVGNERD